MKQELVDTVIINGAFGHKYKLQHWGTGTPYLCKINQEEPPLARWETPKMKKEKLYRCHGCGYAKSPFNLILTPEGSNFDTADNWLCGPCYNQTIAKEKKNATTTKDIKCRT